MQPDSNFTPQYSQTPPAPTMAPPPRSKSKLAKLLAILLVLVIGAAGGGAFVLMNSLNSKDKELSSVRADLESTKQELTAAKTKIEELDSPQKKANDEKRKNDLAKFVAKLNEYADAHNGEYPSTEPSFFAKDFEALYVTGKISDFTDPNSKQPYEFTPVAKVQTPPGVTLGNIQYQWPGKCLGSEFEDVDSEREAAARLILESGEKYCINA